MKHLFFALCVALLLSTAVGSAQQQPKKAVIEGVVSAVGTAAPIPAARVTLARQGRGAPGIAGAADRVAPPAPGQPGGPAGPRGARGAGPAFQPIPPVMTDEAGHFVFQDVDEGSYTISVIANGYVGQSYGQRYSGGPGTPINVVAGQEFKDAAVALTPAGNISGRIVDPFDQPLINVPIQVFRYSYDSTGQRSYQSAGNAVTDDRGEYRIYWLTPGRYYLQAGSVSAGPNSMLDIASTMLAPFGASTPNANIMPIPLNYAYYPGVTSVADARPIDLLPGAEVGGIDLRLTPRPKTFRVRGRLIDPRTNMPPANASVTISPQSLDPTLAGLSLEMVAADLPSVNYNAATGGMDFRDLLPGIYTVTAGAQDGQVDPRQVDPRQLDPRQFDPTAGGFGGANFVAPRRLTGTATVVVSDRDIDNLVVTVTPAATIQGQIRVDGQIPPTTTLQQMRIQLQEVGTATRATGGLSASAQPQADGSFRLDNVAAGAYRVMVLALGGGGFGGGGRGGFGGGGFGGGGGGAPARGGPATPINVYLKESRFQGADALDSPLRISGPATGTLDLVVGFGSGQISGVVADSRFQPAPVTQVVLVPARSRSRTELFKTATTDENGRFTITNIAPGDYRVFSWEAVEPYGWFDPDLLAASEAGGQAVQISEGSAASIELRMIPAGGAR